VRSVVEIPPRVGYRVGVEPFLAHSASLLWKVAPVKSHRFAQGLWGLLAVVALGCQAEIPKETAVSSHDAAPADHAAPSAAGAKRIIILTNGNSPFWDACRAGILDADRELKLADAGLQGVMEVNDGTPQGQLDKLRQFGSQTDVAAIGVSAIDANNVAIAEELHKLKDRGIHVVTIDSDLDREKFRESRHAFIGTDNLGGGRVLGQAAKGLRPDGGEYVTFVGRTGAQNAIERIGGFGEGAGEKFVAKDSMGDDLDRSRAQDNVRNALRNHPNLNVLVGIWSYNAPAIVDVVREQKVRDKVSVVVFDAEPQTIIYMGEGDVDAMVVQDPYAMGYQGVKMLKALVQKDEAVLAEMLPNFGQPGGDIYDTGIKVVVPNDGSPLKADHFTGKVQFLPLSQFQEWLTKYGLTGS
jgi:ribose transport system substrate-binding protein